jgi:hypothetical protein
VKLELIHCGFSRFEDLNPTNTLKELKITSPTDLQILCSLDGISKLEIQSGWSVELIFPRNFVDFELECVNFSKILTTDFRCAVPNERFRMTYYFPVEFTRFAEFQNYPAINLRNQNYHIFPSLPLFYGSDISLRRFCLSQWNNTVLTNVKTLHLSRCSSLIDIPEMPQVEVLSLERCPECKIVPVFQSLLNLKVQSCFGIRSVSFCPKMKEAGFGGCHNLCDIIACGHLTELTISFCGKIFLGDLSFLRFIPKLSLADVRLPKLIGVEREVSGQRKYLHVGSCFHLNDFSFCRNILELELYSLGNLYSCEGIMNIHHLTVRSCYYLTSSRGLRNITGSVSFSSCYKMTSLVDVLNIPEIEIIDCKSLADFGGLGNNQRLFIKGDENGLFKKQNPEIMKAIQQIILE